MNDALFEVLKAVVVLAVVLLTRYAVPYVKGQVEKSKYSWLITWVDIAVRAAEQTVFGEASGQQKKEIVVDFIKELSLSKNICISDEQLDKLIEATVFEMNGGKK
jgi:hypothetical protein